MKCSFCGLGWCCVGNIAAGQDCRGSRRRGKQTGIIARIGVSSGVRGISKYLMGSY